MQAYIQARKALLEGLKEHEVNQKRKQELLRAWQEYQEKERAGEADFEFLDKLVGSIPSGGDAVKDSEEAF